MVMRIQCHSRQAYVLLQQRCYSQIFSTAGELSSIQQHQPYSNYQQLFLFICIGHRRCLPDYHDVLRHDVFFHFEIQPP